MEVKQRRAAVDRRRPSLSVARQCKLLDISRSGLYYQPVGVSDEDLSLMKLIDRQYMVTPFYGTRKMAAWLKSKRYSVNRKHVRRLMQLMGLKVIYHHPRTSPPGPGNKIYPYLLNGLQITKPNQVWCADITYIRWHTASCIWWSSWTGTAGTYWHGGYQIRWMLISVWRRWKRRLGKEDRIFSIQTRDPNLPTRLSSDFWRNTESKSAWTVKEVTETTCLSRGYGEQ